MIVRKILALDLAGILEDSWPAKRAYFFQRHAIDVGERPLSEDALRVRFCINVPAYEQMKAAVYSTSAILDHPAVEGAIDGVKRASKEYDVFVLTSRSHAKRDVSEQWLIAHGLAELVGHRLVTFRPPEEDFDPRSKLLWCQEHPVVALVDDRIENLDSVPSTGTFRRLLFASEFRGSVRGDISVVSSWEEILCHLAVLRTKAPPN